MDVAALEPPPDGLSGLSDDAVGLVFDQYAAVMASAHAHLLAVIAELASRERLVCGDGCRSVGAWVAARAGVRRATGEAWAATASRLADLPGMWSVFAEGELSFDQVRPASALATPDTDDAVTELAKITSAAGLARAAADARRVERHKNRAEIDHVRVSDNAEGTGGRIRGELFGDVYERVRDALEAGASRIPRREDGSYVPPEQRMAAALDELATAGITAGADPDRATIVIHADADRLRAAGDDEPAGTALFGSGLPVDSDTLRRLTCDCRAQLVANDAAGYPVAVGSPLRTAPRWLRRLLVRRDRWCTFPGCEATHHLHAHHIVHWADGGPTIVENLVMICPYHHRAVHEGGWTVALHRDGTTTWTRPDGHPHIVGPHTRLRELKRRLAHDRDPANRTGRQAPGRPADTSDSPGTAAIGDARSTGDPPSGAPPPPGDPPSSSDPPAPTATGTGTG